jgi:hypothetical protein
VNVLFLQFFIFTVAGWVHRGQQDVIEYLKEENCILREQLGFDASASRMTSAEDWQCGPSR